MAETFLLLVFCLLLVAAAVITGERQVRKRAVIARDSVVAELGIAAQDAESLANQNKLLSEKNERLERLVADAPVDEDWRELTSDRDTVKKLSEQGLSKHEVLTLAPSMKLLKEQGFAKDDAALAADQLGKLFSAVGATKLHLYAPEGQHP